MWGSLCSCPIPCAALCYRRCTPCRTPCYSYARATLPPSAIPSVRFKDKGKKKKTKERKYSARMLQKMTPSQIAVLPKAELEKMTPSQLALVTPSVQNLILKRMKEEGISLNKFGVAGINVAVALSRNTYAGSEGGFVTRRCDPRCRARRTRPATAGCIPRQPMKDFCASRYNTETSVYCGIGGIYKTDATTATDIKMNASTSTNNLDIFCFMQKAATDSMQSDICSNQQYNQAIQHQYNLALQQQWLQKCYYYQVLAQQNPFGYNNFSSSRVPQLASTQNAMRTNIHTSQQGFPQGVVQSHNSFQQNMLPCSSLFSGPFSYSSNQSVFPYNNVNLSWPGVGSPTHSANICSTGKKCETCGRIRNKR